MSKPEVKNPYLLEIYRWIIIICGFTVLGISCFTIFSTNLDPKFFILLTLTALIASRINIKFPKFHGTITVSDAFIFLALLLWGSPAAILVATTDSIALTIKIKSRLVRTYLFNIASTSLITWITATVLKTFFGDPTKFADGLVFTSFIVAMCVMALTHYVASMALNSILQALKLGFSLWKDWSTYFLWSCITFFIGAAVAGIIIKLLSSLGLVAVLLVSPIVFLVYLSYESYLKSHEALQESEARFRSSFSYATIGMALVSPEGKWLQVNKTLENILTSNKEELLTSYYQDVLDPGDLPEITKKTQKLMEGKSPAFQTEVRFLNKNNQRVWVSLGVSTAKDLQGKLRHFIFQIQDITLRKQAEEKLRYDALHDALTGLPNRKAFLAKLTSSLRKSSDKRDRLLATLFLDLDGFKIINDSLGHNVGDDLLKEVSSRLLECVRSHDTVARLGGDEFTILLEKVKDIKQITTIAERIKNRICEPINLEGQEVFVGTSIGIATTELTYTNPNDILRDADAAMYQAKARGKGCYVLFDEEMFANASKELRLANDLRRAIERKELQLYYQAVKTLDNDKICRFEALMRWNHPQLGLLVPPDFIHIAEENGLITQVDNWGLKEACYQMKKWQNKHPEYKDLVVSVNASNKQFSQIGFADEVKKILQETELDAKCLQIEITESVMADNLAKTIEILNHLNKIGVKIALDDFGTGYSSLSYLHELPITTLKIDRSFISQISSKSDGAEIVKTIILLANNLNMEVVAEGIETEKQLEILKSIGCELGQGYLFSRPIIAKEALTLLKEESDTDFIPQSNENRLRLVSGN